jgi:1,2-phenylacetyl-CoA epoxidase PaaB subunit
MFAKEQYARRGKTTNLWVVKTSDVYTFGTSDEDILRPRPRRHFATRVSMKYAKE